MKLDKNKIKSDKIRNIVETLNDIAANSYLNNKGKNISAVIKIKLKKIANALDSICMTDEASQIDEIIG